MRDAQARTTLQCYGTKNDRWTWKPMDLKLASLEGDGDLEERKAEEG